MESPGPQQSSPVCTFIVRSRKRPSNASSYEPSRSMTQNRNDAGSSPGYNPSLSPQILTFDRPIGLKESSSAGTFGGFPNLESPQSIAATSPTSDTFRRLYSPTQSSPLNQYFIPPILSSKPMIVGFSDSSGDGPTLRTPVDFLSEMAGPNLATSETRASLFTISAYSRTDNMKTPIVDSSHELDKLPTDPTRRVSFRDHSLPPKALHAALLSSSPSTMRRAHRPAPLTLDANTLKSSYPMAPLDSLQTTGSSTDYANSDHPSAVEEPRVHKGLRRGMQRYNQVSKLPSLPVVEFVKRVCVELRIDQEEHRTIRPQFTFKRHIAKQAGNVTLRPSTALRGPEAFWNNVTAAGLVDFRMSAKEVGTFHCGVSVQS